MGKEPEWKVDKQPAWLVAAIRRTIADLPHGYEEAAEILGLYKSDDITPAKDQLHNRLRSGGDQIFPPGVGHGFTGCQWYQACNGCDSAS